MINKLGIRACFVFVGLNEGTAGYYGNPLRYWYQMVGLYFLWHMHLLVSKLQRTYLPLHFPSLHGPPIDPAVKYIDRNLCCK